MLKEIIVVEGKDDVAAVKRAVDAQVYTTNGYAFNEKTIKTLIELQKRRGLIILTDPDYQGERIRRILTKRIPDSKHAFIPREYAERSGNIGVENAEPEAIREAIKKARPRIVDREETFDKNDLVSFGLIGAKDSSLKRERLGKLLGIGYANGKQLLLRLNNLGISKEEFLRAMERIEKDGI